MARGARGGGIVVAGQFTRLALQLAGTVILSRLLSPADFGLIAMVLVFTSLGALLRDFGLSTVVLQARTLTQQQASNLFWLSAGLSTAVAAGLALATPLIVLLFEEPRLATIAPLLAVALLVDGVQAPLQMQLARRMRFSALTATDLIAQTTSLALAVWCAIAGWGYWALVVQALSAAVMLLVLRAILARWIPSLPRRGYGSKEHFRAGGEFGLAQLLAFAANNADTVVLGARWGATDLGFYSKAFQLYSLPRSGLLDPLTQVTIPTVNAAIESGEHSINTLLLRLQFLLSAVLTWVYVVAAATAEWLIPLVLGPQWQVSILPFQLLCIGGAFVAFSTISYWAFVLHHQSRQLLYLHLITKPLAVALILAASPMGIAGIALAYSLGLALAWPINLVWLARKAKQNSWAYFRGGLRTLGAAAVSFLATRLLLELLPELPSIVTILIGGAAASIFYIAALIIAPGGFRLVAEALTSVLLTLKSKRRANGR